MTRQIRTVHGHQSPKCAHVTSALRRSWVHAVFPRRVLLRTWFASLNGLVGSYRFPSEVVIYVVCLSQHTPTSSTFREDTAVPRRTHMALSSRPGPQRPRSFGSRHIHPLIPVFGAIVTSCTLHLRDEMYQSRLVPKTNPAMGFCLDPF